MKRILAIATFVFALTLTAVAAPKSEPVQLTKQQLNTLIATAKTPADHLKIAAYYRAQADQLQAEADQHAQMAAQFAANPTTNNAKAARATVGHCTYIAQTLKAKSAKAAALAEEHTRMAEAAGQK